MYDFAEQPGGSSEQDPAPRVKPEVGGLKPEAGKSASIDTANHFEVIAKANVLEIRKPPGRPITVREGLGLAAWLVAMAKEIDPSAAEQFPKVLEKIKNS